MSDAGGDRSGQHGEPDPAPDFGPDPGPDRERAPDGSAEPAPMDRRSIAGLAVSAGLAVVGLFALPPLRSLGLSFMEAFWTAIALEFVAFVGVVVSVLRLHRDRSAG